MRTCSSYLTMPMPSIKILSMSLNFPDWTQKQVLTHSLLHGNTSFCSQSNPKSWHSGTRIKTKLCVYSLKTSAGLGSLYVAKCSQCPFLYYPKSPFIQMITHHIPWRWTAIIFKSQNRVSGFTVRLHWCRRIQCIALLLDGYILPSDSMTSPAWRLLDIRRNSFLSNTSPIAYCSHRRIKASLVLLIVRPTTHHRIMSYHQREWWSVTGGAVAWM